LVKEGRTFLKKLGFHKIGRVREKRANRFYVLLGEREKRKESMIEKGA
jgi:hypothetical protein